RQLLRQHAVDQRLAERVQDEPAVPEQERQRGEDEKRVDANGGDEFPPPLPRDQIRRDRKLFARPLGLLRRRLHVTSPQSSARTSSRGSGRRASRRWTPPCPIEPGRWTASRRSRIRSWQSSRRTRDCTRTVTTRWWRRTDRLR